MNYGKKEFLLYGDIVSFLNIFVVIGALGLPNSIIVYTKNIKGLKSSILFLSSIFSIVLVTLGVLVLVLTFDYYSFNYLKSIPFRFVFMFSVITLVTISFKYAALISKRELRSYHLLQILQNCVAIALVFFGIRLDIFVFVIYSLGISAFIYLYPQIVTLTRLFKKGFLFKRVFTNTDISYFMIIGILSSLVVPSIQILGRSLFLSSSDLSIASAYHASLKVSEGYMLFVNLILFTLILPKYGEISKNYLRLYGRLVVIIIFFFIFLLACMLLFGQDIYTLIFDASLSKFSSLASYMVISDMFRTISLSLALFFYAKRYFKIYALLELFSALILFLGTFMIGRLSVSDFYILWILINVIIAFTYLIFFIVYGRN